MAKKTKTERSVEKVLRPYELIVIMSPDLRENEVKKKLKELIDLVESNDGKVTAEDFWGKKTMAYRIGRHKEGYYAVYNLMMNNTFVHEVKQHLRIEKEVVRSMILSVPEDYTYIKYDVEGMAAENAKQKTAKKPVIEKPAEAKKSKSETVEEKPKAKKTEAEEKSDNLDKKLDHILEGDDLKL